MTEIEASGVGYIPTELGVQLTQLGVERMSRPNPWDEIKLVLRTHISSEDHQKWLENTAFGELAGNVWVLTERAKKG